MNSDHFPLYCIVSLPCIICIMCMPCTCSGVRSLYILLLIFKRKGCWSDQLLSYIQISVYSPSKQAVITTSVTQKLKKLTRAVAGGNTKSICRAVFAIPDLKNEVEYRISRILDSECVTLCCKRIMSISLFRAMSLKQAELFTWTQAITELKEKAPTFYKIYLCP